MPLAAWRHLLFWLDPERKNLELTASLPPELFKGRHRTKGRFEFGLGRH
jgi:hypothetical protein